MPAMVIGGFVLCCEPGCQGVFASMRDYDEHMERVHMAQDEGERGDVAYAEGLRREL